MALLAGLWMESSLALAPPPALLVALMALALALRRRGAMALAALVAGVLIGAVNGRPLRDALAAVDSGRPVEAVVRIAAPAQRWEQTWAAPARLDTLRQGGTVLPGGARVWLTLGGPEPPVVGAVLRVRGYVARPVGFANLVDTDRRAPPRLRVKSWRLVEVEGEGGFIGRFQLELRRRLDAAGGNRPGAALARALVLGDLRGLEESDLRGLRRTGLIHLLSLSGLHVAMLGGLVLWLASPLGRFWQRLATALVVTGYVAVAGPYPALLRAVTMGLLALLALSLRRSPVAVNALAVAAALLAGTSSETLHDLGFQLSCSATAGLVLLTGPIAERLSRAPGWLARSIGATLAAQVASLPWALPALSTISPVSVLLNLLAVPWATAMLAASLGWFALAWTSATLGRSVMPMLDFLALPAGIPARLPAAAWVVAPCPAHWLDAAVLAGTLLGLLLARGGPRRALVLGLGLLVLVGTGSRRQDPFEAVFFDVGQGDAILLRDGSSALLVDGGGLRGLDLARRVLVPNLSRLGLDRLSAVALTHPDLDHCGGLVDLLSYLPAERLWLPAGLAGGGCVEELVAAFAGTPDRLSAGDVREIGRWRVDVVSPAGTATGDKENDRSLVLAASGGDRRILLAGDLEATGEERVLGAGRLTACDILKVGHHGGASSSSPRWLDVLRPRLAVVSCGVRNRYGHPAAETLARFAARGTKVLRTDRDGMVMLRWREGGPLDLRLPASPR